MDVDDAFRTLHDICGDELDRREAVGITVPDTGPRPDINYITGFCIGMLTDELQNAADDVGYDFAEGYAFGVESGKQLDEYAAAGRTPEEMVVATREVVTAARERAIELRQ